ncbi:SH3 type 3 domain protein [Crinalium epipsammum PCC 9333]|uniref:SH3 type 3 domain protein n=1 Tax=Crinalium epipsammum PCC 9333 TaxID=1173022 RepID=K9W388_9CYAN|nr:SH3 domain-containing protein [Crinalium epipsammum]AFZ14212.1 SH3 type 3 domain protein [Crinalium epipsammum PCC 9333]
MIYFKQNIATLALISVSLTASQLILQPITKAEKVNFSTSTLLVANKGICSFITANNVNIRSQPGTQFKVVANLKMGDGVIAVLRKGNWVQISGKITSKPGVVPEVVKPIKGWVLNTYINACSGEHFDQWRI